MKDKTLNEWIGEHKGFDIKTGDTLDKTNNDHKLIVNKSQWQFFEKNLEYTKTQMRNKFTLNKKAPVEQQASVATSEELKKMYRQCWHTGCKKKAFLKDWTGWKYCIDHWYREINSIERKTLKEKKFYFKSTEVF